MIGPLHLCPCPEPTHLRLRSPCIWRLIKILIRLLSVVAVHSFMVLLVLHLNQNRLVELDKLNLEHCFRFKGEAGEIAREEGVDFANADSLRLDFKNILKIDNLWMFQRCVFNV